MPTRSRRPTKWLTVLAVVAGARAAVAAEEIAVESRIVSVRMFKNGLAVVERTLEVSAPGVYRVADVPEPIHGTFWIESEAKADVRMTTRELEMPARADANLQEDLAGRDVLVHLREPQAPSIAGKVRKIEPPRVGSAGRLAEPAGDYGASAYRPGWPSGSWMPPAATPGTRFLVLETEKGHALIDPAQVGWIEVQGATAAVKRRMPVLVFDVKEVGKKPATILISYLARGMAWAPSYRVDISDPATLTLRQSAVVKNELVDLEDAELSLISGFPNIEFGHVTSPLSLATGLQQFFTQLNERHPAPGHASLGNAVMQQAVMSNDRGGGGADLAAVPGGEGPDVHYQSIGRRTLAAGDALSLEVASATAAYDRIVEWRVPDARSAEGTLANEYERQQRPEDYEDAAWDAIRFKNPLGFPMTTAPALFVAKGRFLGESMSGWTNAGEEAVLRVTKALSVRTRCVENEAEGGERAVLNIGGNNYRKVVVKGVASINNHRAEAVHMLIRRRFSGELVEAEGSPKKTLREEGVYSVNKRSELVWDMVIAAGEEKTLAYRYEVLVRH